MIISLFQAQSSCGCLRKEASERKTDGGWCPSFFLSLALFSSPTTKSLEKTKWLLTKYYGLLTQTNYPLTVNKQSLNVSTDMSDNTVFDLKRSHWLGSLQNEQINLPRLNQHQQ